MFSHQHSTGTHKTLSCRSSRRISPGLALLRTAAATVVAVCATLSILSLEALKLVMVSRVFPCSRGDRPYETLGHCKATTARSQSLEEEDNVGAKYLLLEEESCCGRLLDCRCRRSANKGQSIVQESDKYTPQDRQEEAQTPSSQVR